MEVANDCVRVDVRPPSCREVSYIKKESSGCLSFRSTRLVLSGSVHAYASGDVADRSLNVLISIDHASEPRLEGSGCFFQNCISLLKRLCFFFLLGDRFEVVDMMC